MSEIDPNVCLCDSCGKAFDHELYSECPYCGDKWLNKKTDEYALRKIKKLFYGLYEEIESLHEKTDDKHLSFILEEALEGLGEFISTFNEEVKC